MTANRRRLRIILGYRGTDLHGWQYQDHVPTVEGDLRRALQRLSKSDDPVSDVETAGASRTDTGVHAVGQNCLCTMTTDLPSEEIGRALQSLTAPDLWIRSVVEVDEGFHPRFSAVEKRYLYRVANGSCPRPFGPDLHWWVQPRLDLRAMRSASASLLGEHDFASFQNVSKDPPDSSVRTIRAVDWMAHGDDLTFQVIGDGFLYKMVRNLVGTLVEVGRGKRGADSVSAILAARDRTQAGITAPPRGLYLMEIRYEGEPALTLDSSPFSPA